MLKKNEKVICLIVPEKFHREVKTIASTEGKSIKALICGIVGRALNLDEFKAVQEQ